MPVTIREIAERVGLSVQTVSRVLNGMGHLHRPRTCSRVLRAAKELGYLPNSSARAVRTGRFGCVALVSSTGRAGPLPEPLLRGAHDELARRDIHLTFAALPDEKLTNRSFVPKMLRQLMADGLLINYHFNIPARMMELVKTHRVPAVWINCEKEFDSVLPDDFGAGRMAAERLLNLGHRAIVYADFSHPSLGRPEHHSAVDRYKGYAAAMREAGLEARRWSVEDFPGAGSRLELAARLLSAGGRPTGLVTYGETEALTLFAAAASSGLAVPTDLSIVAIWDRLLDAAGWPIDTVVLPWYEIGREAVLMLHQKIERPGAALARRVLAPTLAEGRSCAAVRG